MVMTCLLIYLLICWSHSWVIHISLMIGAEVVSWNHLCTDLSILSVDLILGLSINDHQWFITSRNSKIMIYLLVTTLCWFFCMISSATVLNTWDMISGEYVFIRSVYGVPASLDWSHKGLCLIQIFWPSEPHIALVQLNFSFPINTPTMQW